VDKKINKRKRPIAKVNPSHQKKELKAKLRRKRI
jgi:hypothetical protein